MAGYDAQSRAGRPPATESARVAAIALYLQVLAIIGALVFYAYETVRGETDNVTRAVMSMVTIAALGLFVAIVARRLALGSYGARMPAIVWNVMLLPVGFDLVRGGQALWGVPLLLSAIVVIVGCVLDMKARPGA